MAWVSALWYDFVDTWYKVLKYVYTV